MAPIDVVQAQSQAATQRQNAGRPRSRHDADRRARAQAADRRRHAGSELERRASIRPIGPISAPSRSTSRRPSAARSASAPTSQIAKKNIAGQRRHAEVPASTRCCRRPTSWPRYGLVGLGGTAVHLRTGTGVGTVNRSVTGTIPGGYSDALTSLFRTQLPALDRGAEHQLSARRQRAGSDGRARARPAEPGRRRRSSRSSCRSRPTSPTRRSTVQSNVERVQAAQAARELAQKTARSRAEQVRSRHVDQLLRRPGAARSRDGAEQRAAGGAQLPQVARRARARCSRRRCTNLNITILTAPR